jgi:N-acetylmuramoyl-L-alanine amidase
MFRILLLFFTLCAVCAGPVMAAGADQAYKKASESYQRLMGSAKKQQHRDQWLAVLDRFTAVIEMEPGSSTAADALYMAAQTCEGLYRVSWVKKDARRAVEFYATLARKHAASSLADDALAQAAEIEETVLKELDHAYRLYTQIVERYPQGDRAPAARLRLKALSGHAPPSSPAAPAAAAGKGGSELTGLRVWSNAGYTRIVLDLNRTTEFTANVLPANAATGSEPRLYVDIAGSAAPQLLSEVTTIEDGLVRRIRTGVPGENRVRVVFDLVSFGDYKVFALEDPYRIVVDIAGAGTPEIKSAEPELRSLPPTPQDGIGRILDQAPVDRPLTIHIPAGQKNGKLRRIVVDAGHGGKDPGAVGVSGVLEKDVTLAMAKVLAQRLEEEFGCEVLLSRNGDVFLPLEERTGFANKVGADLFISIHANASTNSKAYGVETYYLNFSKNEQAMAVAARENGTSLKQVGDLELILFDLMANSKINESSRLAAEIQKSLVEKLGKHYKQIKDLGVRQGPFHVLLGATMPSVLVETAFLSNSREENRLTDHKFHERTADAIIGGVRNFANALEMMAAR